MKTEREIVLEEALLDLLKPTYKHIDGYYANIINQALNFKEEVIEDTEENRYFYAKKLFKKHDQMGMVKKTWKTLLGDNFDEFMMFININELEEALLDSTIKTLTVDEIRKLDSFYDSCPGILNKVLEMAQTNSEKIMTIIQDAMLKFEASLKVTSKIQ